MTTINTADNKEFVRAGATLGLRDDGRQMLETRQMKIIFNEQQDGVEISLGKTKVYSKISSKIIEPSSNHPNEGKISFMVNLKLLMDTKQAFTEAKSQELSIEISKVLERIIIGSKALDPDSLCILTGKYAWDIKCELSVLNNDGNLLDACNYAAIIALHCYKLPFVSVEGGKLKVWQRSEKRPQTLSIHHWPILLSFGVLNENDDSETGISEYVVLDPSKIEEDSFNGRISICMNVYGDLCGIHFPGGSSIPGKILKSLITFCKMKSAEITHNIREYLKNFEENNFELYRKDGKIEVQFHEGVEEETPVAVVGNDDSSQQEDEELRMRFNQMDIESQEDDGEEEEVLDEEDIADLKKALR